MKPKPGEKWKKIGTRIVVEILELKTIKGVEFVVKRFGPCRYHTQSVDTFVKHFMKIS